MLRHTVTLLKRVKRSLVTRLLPPGRLRRRVASRHLARGVGLDLGALHLPFPVPKGTRVVNVDYLTGPALRRRYPEIDPGLLSRVHLVDSAERLASIRAGSVDFVIASHVIEHMEDPIGALGAWLRVLRPGGTLLLVVPDRRHTFDRHRDPTPWGHLVADHADGGRASRAGHYREWVTKVDGVADESADRSAAALLTAGYSIHFHVWDAGELDDFLERCRSLVPAYRRTYFGAGHREIIAVLERTPEGPGVY